MKTVFLLLISLFCFSYLSAGFHVPKAEGFGYPLNSAHEKKAYDDFKVVADEQTVKVKVSSLFSDTFVVRPGAQLGQVGNLSFYFDKENYAVTNADSNPGIVYKSTDIVSEDMEIVVNEKIHVVIGKPFNRDAYVFPESTLNQLVQDYQIDPRKYIFIKRSTWEILELTYVLSDGDQLALCHNVTVSNATGKTYFFVEHQEPLQSNADLVLFASGYHLAKTNEANKTEVLLTFEVVNDLGFVLCSLVTTDGAASIQVLVESGKQQLGDTKLRKYLEPEQLYEVWDSVDQSHFYSLTDVINADTRMTITDKCDTFNKAGCWETRSVCDWDKKNHWCARKGTVEDGVGLASGVIIAICVCVGVVVVIVLVAVVVFIIKKRKD